MTDTPRTRNVSLQSFGMCDADAYAKMHDHARGLGRGLAAVTAERDAWRAAKQWRPIETAPKDGTRILVIDTNQSVHYVRWTLFSNLWQDVHGDVWRDSFIELTHWMPLPQPPETP